MDFRNGLRTKNTIQCNGARACTRVPAALPFTRVGSGFSGKPTRTFISRLGRKRRVVEGALRVAGERERLLARGHIERAGIGLHARICAERRKGEQSG